MFLKVIKKKDVTRLYFYESYYIPSKVKGQEGKCRQHMLESLGSLEDLKKIYDDPIAHFKELAKIRTEEKDKERHQTATIDHDATMNINTDDFKNAGYGILKILYKELRLDIFWRGKAQQRKMEYNAEGIFRLLVLSRILYPDSKKRTFENQKKFFEKPGKFSLDDVYHALTFFAENKETLQQWIFENSAAICKRDMSVSYFDCTNYYFDISRPDVDIMDDEGNVVDKDGNPAKPRYRKRGPEKNHRPDPIVEMGLLMDRNGIPIAYDLFPGNESEKLHMSPVITRVKNDFSDTKIIFVADKGLNTSDNIYYLNGDNKCENNQRDGYVYGQTVRGADAEFKEWVLEKGYKNDKVIDDEGSKITFRHKSRIIPRTLHVNVKSEDGKKKRKKSVTVDQKQMVYYSEKYAARQKRNRLIMVERAKSLIKNPSLYSKSTTAGSAAYINNISFNKNTGEVVKGRNLSLNIEKIKEEEKYDGYYAIVTSELNMSDFEMRDVYSGLSRIEDTFKISKSDFESRPVYVRTNDHIDAHFATCFTALVLIRLLQLKLDNKYPVGKILNSLKEYKCMQVDSNTFKFGYYDEILDECSKAFGIKLNCQYRSRLEMRRLLKY